MTANTRPYPKIEDTFDSAPTKEASASGITTVDRHLTSEHQCLGSFDHHHLSFRSNYIQDHWLNTIWDRPGISWINSIIRDRWIIVI